jgi:Mce-associated membrane protein
MAVDVDASERQLTVSPITGGDEAHAHRGPGPRSALIFDYTRVDADIHRVLESSTGAFHAEFEKTSPEFVQVVKNSQSRTEGAITEAGIESVTGDSARVLVGVSVKTSNVAAPQQQPRFWRLRVDVQKVGDTVKVSNVGFVA